MAPTSTLRATSLRLLIVCVVLSALLGVIALLGDASEGMWRVLATSLCGTGASLLTFIGATGLARPGLRWCGLLAISASLVGFGLLVAMMWEVIGARSSEGLAKTSGVAIVAGVAAAHAVLLGLAQLRTQHRWLRRVTFVLIGVFAFQLSLAILGGAEGEGFARATGIVGVLTGAGTLIVSILASMARGVKQTSVQGLGARVQYCPACGDGIEDARTVLRCGACGATFRVSFEGASASPFQ